MSFIGRNLWLKTKYPGIDPDTNLAGTNLIGIDYWGMPNTRSFQVHVTLGF